MILHGATEEQIKNILKGITPAGDAVKLGGETAEAWDLRLKELEENSSGGEQHVTGSYNGNGTTQTIKVAESGTLLMVYASTCAGIATHAGMFGIQNGSQMLVKKSEITFIDGTLTLNTSSPYCNASASSYSYYLIS